MASSRCRVAAVDDVRVIDNWSERNRKWNWRLRRGLRDRFSRYDQKQKSKQREASPCKKIDFFKTQKQ